MWLNQSTYPHPLDLSVSLEKRSDASSYSSLQLFASLLLLLQQTLRASYRDFSPLSGSEAPATILLLLLLALISTCLDRCWNIDVLAIL